MFVKYPAHELGQFRLETLRLPLRRALRDVAAAARHVLQYLLVNLVRYVSVHGLQPVNRHGLQLRQSQQFRPQYPSYIIYRSSS